MPGASLNVFQSLNFVRQLLSDPLKHMARGFERHGDTLRLNLPGRTVVLTRSPSLVRRAFITHAQNYSKQVGMVPTYLVLGHSSLLVTEGAAWKRLRAVHQPAFSAQTIARHVSSMAETTASFLHSLGNAEAAGVSVYPVMLELTLRIIGRELFGDDLSSLVASVVTSLETCQRHVAGPHAPLWIPSPGNRRFKVAIANLRRVADELVQRCREDASRQNTLLGRLIAARDPETGAPLTNAELGDSVLTNLAAGHETTASVLAWAVGECAARPDVFARVRAEADAVLAKGKLETAEAVQSLTYTSQVIQECLRLHPPTWLLNRRALEADAIDGISIPKNAMCVFSTYHAHRHPEYWPEADAFDTSRFETQPSATEGFWFPFGLGTRKCIGAGFASLEMPLVLALLVTAFDLELDPTGSMNPDAKYTLAPRGLRVKFSRRVRATA